MILLGCWVVIIVALYKTKSIMEKHAGKSSVSRNALLFHVVILSLYFAIDISAEVLHNMTHVGY